MKLLPHREWFIDSYTRSNVAGWVSPWGKAPAKIYVRSGETIVASGLANIYRGDLDEAGKGRSGACAFNLAIEQSAVVDQSVLTLEASVPFVRPLALLIPRSTKVVMLPRLSFLALIWWIRSLRSSELRLYRDLIESSSVSTHVVSSVFEGLLSRVPEQEAINHYNQELLEGLPLRDLVRNIISSPEFKLRTSQEGISHDDARSVIRISSKLLACLEERLFMDGVTLPLNHFIPPAITNSTALIWSTRLIEALSMLSRNTLNKATDCRNLNAAPAEYSIK